MLGKLFSGFPSNGVLNSRPTDPLDSNLEDHFTHNLLFPDAEALCHNDQVFSLSSGTILTPATTNAFDLNGDIDMEMRDVRVIIMQEATPTSGSAYLLYDSHSLPQSAPMIDRQSSNNGSAVPSREGRRSISSRKSSLGGTSKPIVIQQEQPKVLGAFDRRPTQHKTFSHTETEGQRSAREYREEVTTFSNCIFGNSEVLAYKGTGTKVHILPSESRPTTLTPASYAGDGSLGRSSMRSSKLAQSFTSDNVSPAPTSAGFTNTGTASKGSDRKKVLITRMFPVPLPNDDTEDAQNRTPTTQTSQSTDVAGYPFPKLGEPPQKKPQPKQKRTPMYAVGLVVHLPATHASSVPVSRSSFRPGSYNDQESCHSSFNSTRRAGWTMLGHGFGVESMESSFSSDVDDRIDVITQHWDVIMRTLSCIQSVATASLLPMLKQADLSSPDPRKSSHHRAPSGSISISGKRVEESKPFKVNTNVKSVQLMANCLMQVQCINKAVEASRQRIVIGIKALPVIAGQGRWAIWREEARLVGKWAGGKNEGFFFFNLLTGFLGNHTEWLRSLGPIWYRRRHYQRQRSNKDEDTSLAARTIIVSDNKLMARRLVFLLSAFLPTNSQVSGRQHRPSTSTSFGGYSQSPPAIPILREASLRRRINKRSGGTRANHARTLSFPAQPIPGNALEIHHDRRTSDAASIKTANLPIPGSDLGTRKSSAATTSTTVTPVATMPHFSIRPVRGTGPAPRPGSSGSLATEDLLRSLRRGDSTGHSDTSNDSQGQNSGWGSMISGFWGSKRRDSTAATSQPSTDGVEIHDQRYQGTSHKNKLVDMVEEVGARQQSLQRERELRKSDSSSASVSTAKPRLADEGENDDNADDDVAEQIVQINERIPDPNGAFESPVKTSINDGVIDIDVPLPEYLHFDTAVSSPSSSGYSFGTPGLGWGLGNGMEGFEHYTRSGAETETTINVGGWLPHFHPDFSLQAIPKQQNLIEELKTSMRAEPTPIISSTPQPDSKDTGRWVDICSAVVADTTNFTIRHIRYSRFLKPVNIDQSTPSMSKALDSKYGNVYSAAKLAPCVEVDKGDVKERFIEEPIISMDETLIEAVERITAQSGQGSKGSSVCSSRSPSCQGRNRERSNSNAGNGASKPEASAPLYTEDNLEVPRNKCKKMVLTALEEVVRSVVDSRERIAHADEGSPGLIEREREKESFLREGVRAWLGSMEEAE